MAENKQVHVPDIGNAKNVDVIEVLVKPGDKVTEQQSIITLESDKASMDIPVPFAGVVEQVKLKVGDKVSEGDLILTLRAEEQASETVKSSQEESVKPQTSQADSAQLEEVKVPDIGNAKDAEDRKSVV